MYSKQKGLEFAAKPMGTAEDRINYLNNKEKYIGYKLRIPYFSLSQDGVPTQPVLKHFRPDDEVMKHFQIKQSITDRSTDSVRIVFKGYFKVSFTYTRTGKGISVKAVNGDKQARIN